MCAVAAVHPAGQDGSHSHSGCASCNCQCSSDRRGHRPPASQEAVLGIPGADAVSLCAPSFPVRRCRAPKHRRGGTQAYFHPPSQPCTLAGCATCLISASKPCTCPTQMPALQGMSGRDGHLAAGGHVAPAGRPRDGHPPPGSGEEPCSFLSFVCLCTISFPPFSDCALVLPLQPPACLTRPLRHPGTHPVCVFLPGCSAGGPRYRVWLRRSPEVQGMGGVCGCVCVCMVCIVVFCPLVCFLSCILPACLF